MPEDGSDGEKRCRETQQNGNPQDSLIFVETGCEARIKPSRQGSAALNSGRTLPWRNRIHAAAGSS
jgi:hypothetical protein